MAGENTSLLLETTSMIFIEASSTCSGKKKHFSGHNMVTNRIFDASLAQKVAHSCLLSRS